VGPLHLPRDPVPLGRLREQKILLAGEALVGLPQVVQDLGRGHEEPAKLLLEDGLEVVARDLGPALRADVLRGVGRHVHLGAAGAEYEPREQVNRPPRRALDGGPTLVQQSVALGPEVFGDDGCNRRQDPVALRLQPPVPLGAEALGVVGPANALRSGIAYQAVDRRVGEFRAIAGPEPGLMEQPGNGLLPAMLQEQFVDSLPDRRLLWIRQEFPAFPPVSERSCAAEGLAELRSNRNRGGHPVGDLLSLPFGHGSKERVKKPASR
jgi:hypothetical protein